MNFAISRQFLVVASLLANLRPPFASKLAATTPRASVAHCPETAV